MTGDELITLTRELLRDEVSPYLWSNETILRYLQEAEREMCKRTHVILSTSLTAAVTAGTKTVVLPANVIQVLAARISGETRPMRQMRAEHFEAHDQTVSTGTPRFYTMGLGNKRLTLYPEPDANVTVEYLAAIYPSSQFDESSDPGIPEEHHHALGSYAAYRCLRTKDPDGEELQEHQAYRAEWELYLRDLKRELFTYRVGDKAAINLWTQGYNYGR